MKRWRCPKCEDVVKCLATEVAHRCPKNQRKMTQYTLLPPVSPTMDRPPKKGKS